MALGLSCGDDGGGDSDAADAVLSGVVSYAGTPVVGAELVVWQLVEGERTIEAGRGTTDADGRFRVNIVVREPGAGGDRRRVR